MMLRRPSVLFLPCLFVLLSFAGCGDDPTASRDVDDDLARLGFEGRFDGEAFVLQQTIDPRTGVRLDLVATDVRVTGGAPVMVEVDVALRNPTEIPLFGPMRVFLGRFVPSSVTLINGDENLLPIDAMVAPTLQPPVWPYPHFFDYGAAELGDDEMMLGPREISAPRTWQFSMSELGGFSFGSEVWIGTAPDRALLGGHVFLDRDRDGVFDAGEPPAPYGPNGVAITFPDGHVEMTRTDETGRWHVRAPMAGLYEVTWLPPPTLGPFAPVCLTTPDPLKVLLPLGPDGNVLGFDQADIGVDPEPCFLPPSPGADLVILSDGPADSVRTAYYHLIHAAILSSDPADPNQLPFVGLEVRIGFSGCSPDHPVQLFAGADFMETAPPRTWIRLAHDDRGELCDAYFEQSYRFDLGPLWARYTELYGHGGPLVLQLTTPDGQMRRFELVFE